MLLSGQAPFGGENDDEIIRAVEAQKYSMKGRMWTKISPEAKDFVQRCLDPNPSTRLTAKEGLVHPWITKNEHLPHEVDEEHVSDLAKFSNFHKLKQIACAVIAHSMDHEQIKELYDAFEAIDNDHNGFITLQELKDALHKSEYISDDKIENIFESMDLDGEGKIHFNEF